MDVNEIFYVQSEPEVAQPFWKDFPCGKIKYVYSSMPVAAPAYWHVDSYIHDLHMSTFYAKRIETFEVQTQIFHRCNSFYSYTLLNVRVT
jgi:hypothetical protein